MAKYPIFDGHNDALLRFIQDDGITYRDFFRELDSGHIDLVRARRGGFAGGFFAVYVPNPERRIAPDSMPDLSKPYVPAAVEFTYSQSVALRMMADLFKLEAESDGAVKIVRSADELQTCIDSGVFAAIFALRRRGGDRRRPQRAGSVLSSGFALAGHRMEPPDHLRAWRADRVSVDAGYRTRADRRRQTVGAALQ